MFKTILITAAALLLCGCPGTREERPFTLNGRQIVAHATKTELAHLQGILGIAEKDAQLATRFASVKRIVVSDAGAEVAFTGDTLNFSSSAAKKSNVEGAMLLIASSKGQPLRDGRGKVPAQVAARCRQLAAALRQGHNGADASAIEKALK